MMNLVLCIKQKLNGCCFILSYVAPSFWKWSDGNDLNYSNWISGYPTQMKNDCAQIEWSQFHSSNWYNRPCSTLGHYICQAPRGSVLKYMCQLQYDIVTEDVCFKFFFSPPVVSAAAPSMNSIPECVLVGAPRITSSTFQQYVIPF